MRLNEVLKVYVGSKGYRAFIKGNGVYKGLTALSSVKTQNMPGSW